MSTTTSLCTTTPTSNDRLAAAIAHGGTCFAWFLAPLIVYLLKKDDSRFVEQHAMQALLWSLVGTLVSAATCGLAVPLFLVVHVIAALKVLAGEDFEYPIIGDLARRLTERRPL